LCGITLGGCLLARSASIAGERLRAQPADADFYRAKLQTAAFYAAHILPQSAALAATVRSGGDSVAQADPALF
ncbi:MAG: acyl-CoA dehydrogenase C-terminal domain-containing protein, partial [Steroidobacteraceae bacterium]|nr:acyl-CoA dehydrogenase C-terminal domain-containing protein [Steroidobacteraceae bacterium]MDW8258071.1 acyl-CoA dehydrogenase C-terminal domain-containing protein [Gammaproteobacteria bacterium]